MDIDLLLASLDPDELRSLALKLLADLEQRNLYPAVGRGPDKRPSVALWTQKRSLPGRAMRVVR